MTNTTNTPTTDQPTTWVVFRTSDGQTIHHCRDLREAIALRNSAPAGSLMIDEHVEGDDDGPAY